MLIRLKPVVGYLVKVDFEHLKPLSATKLAAALKKLETTFATDQPLCCVANCNDIKQEGFIKVSVLGKKSAGTFQICIIL